MTDTFARGSASLFAAFLAKIVRSDGHIIDFNRLINQSQPFPGLADGLCLCCGFLVQGPGDGTVCEGYERILDAEFLHKQLYGREP